MRLPCLTSKEYGYSRPEIWIHKLKVVEGFHPNHDVLPIGKTEVQRLPGRVSETKQHRAAIWLPCAV